MSFLGIAVGVAGGTMAAAGAAAVAGTGLALSAASASGAFNGKVDKRRTTPEEWAAADLNRSVYDQGKSWQDQLDPKYQQRLETMGVSNEAALKRFQDAEQRYRDAEQRLKPYTQRFEALQRETRGLTQPGLYQQGANSAVNAAWQQAPALESAGVSQAARAGSGSGAQMSAISRGAGALGSAVQQANVGGRGQWLQQVNANRGALGTQFDVYGRRLGGLASELQGLGASLDQYGQGVQAQAAQAGNLFGDYGARVQTGLGLVNQGAGQSAQAQSDRISAQVAQNQARAQAMGQIGGMMTSAGMMGFSAAGGLGGAAGGAAGAGVSNAGGAMGAATRSAIPATYTPGMFGSGLQGQ